MATGDSSRLTRLLTCSRLPQHAAARATHPTSFRTLIKSQHPPSSLSLSQYICGASNTIRCTVSTNRQAKADGKRKRRGLKNTAKTAFHSRVSLWGRLAFPTLRQQSLELEPPPQKKKVPVERSGTSDPGMLRLLGSMSKGGREAKQKYLF